MILSPSALDRCNEPGDWLRLEIELAIDNQRNIIPLIMERFDFGSSTSKKGLTGKLSELQKYNAMSIPAEYFEEAMNKLRGDRFLNRPLESVSHPISEVTKRVTEEQKFAANKAEQVEEKQLTAQEWFERGYTSANHKNVDEAIRCFSEAIILQADNVIAYFNRGTAYSDKYELSRAIKDYTNAIQLESDNADAFYGRGRVYQKKGTLENAIKDYNESIQIKPDYADAYYNRAEVWKEKDDYHAAIADYQKYLDFGGGAKDGDQEEVEGFIQDLKNKI